MNGTEKWRLTQLDGELCRQDRLILELFADQPVRYVGADSIFAKNLNIDNSSSNLILVVNTALWLSELASLIKENLSLPVTKFYISVNRYTILGNDTDISITQNVSAGAGILNFVETIVRQQGYSITQQGLFDEDRGQYYNFVQPLTWLAGRYEINTSQSN